MRYHKDQPEEFVLSSRENMLSCGIHVHIIDSSLAYNVVTALEQGISVLHQDYDQYR